MTISIDIKKKKHETVICVFQNCNFRTNIYGTFASHRSRKHTPHSLHDFKADIIKRCIEEVVKELNFVSRSASGPIIKVVADKMGKK